MTHRIFILSVCLSLVAGCYEPKEGCLDVSAVNFDASADENCCCEYPELKVTVLHRFDSSVWQTDSVYFNGLGLPYRLRSVAMYLAGFGLEQNGVIYGVEDTLSMKTYQPSGSDTSRTTFTDDFQLIRRAPSEYGIGLFPFGGVFQSARFYLGLADSAQAVIPSQTPQGHPLQPQAEGLWLGRDTAYAHLFLVVQRDTTAGAPTDTLLFTRRDFDPIMINETRNFTREIGYDFKLRLTINYAALFRDVNWQNGDKNTWKSSIIPNLPLAFSVSQ
jgi:hypothetical protein